MSNIEEEFEKSEENEILTPDPEINLKDTNNDRKNESESDTNLSEIKSADVASPFDRIPEDIIKVIFSELSEWDLANVSMTNSRMNAISCSDDLWRKFNDSVHRHKTGQKVFWVKVLLNIRNMKKGFGYPNNWEKHQSEEKIGFF
eukprot:TRINITY_DN11692_c0_g1_i1.p1 TRINITY_DN11692_c0_g1~~TRINITY_DN11692_c0_g1_i1.p1  ORF type:complete len:145 (-),score=26.43 TRINITY_DN11692_c0_g1_i1:553-987(-)